MIIWLLKFNRRKGNDDLWKSLEMKRMKGKFSKDRAEIKKGQTEHRTATTAYPCYLPILGEFSRSWSCRLAGCEDNILMFQFTSPKKNKSFR